MTDGGQNATASPPLAHEILSPWAGFAPPHSNIGACDASRKAQVADIHVDIGVNDAIVYSCDYYDHCDYEECN